MKKKKIITLTLVMASMASGLLPSSMVSAKNISSMPDSITVVYEEDGDVLPISSSNKKSTQVMSDEEALKVWQPLAYREDMLADDLSLDYVKKHDGESVATLTNFPALRLAIENLLGVDKIYAFGRYNEDGSTDKLNKAAFNSISISKGLYGSSWRYGDNNLANFTLADTNIAKSNRDKLAEFTGSYLNLEKDLSSSPFVSLYTYYGILNDSKNLLKLPNSLNDNIEKEDLMTLLVSTNTFGCTNKFWTNSELLADKLYGEKTIEKAFSLSEKYAKNKYNQAALTEYFAHCAFAGNFYDMEDISKANLNSSISKLEAMYDITAPADVNGIYTGEECASCHYINDFHGAAAVLVNGGGVGDERWGLDTVDVVKDFDAKKLPLKNVVVSYNKFMDSNDDTDTEVYRKMAKNIKKNTKSDSYKYDCTDGTTYAETINKKTGKYKKVKVKKKIYVPCKERLGNGQIYTYNKVKYKTVTKKVAITKKYTRVVFTEIRFSDESISKIRKDFNNTFTDGSSYHIMSADELAKAKEAVGYYTIFATKGYCSAQSKLNAYAMKKKVLTPEMASRILVGYGYGLFTASKDKRLDLYSPVTWNDALTWHNNMLLNTTFDNVYFTLNR